jgi:hypothetical protein
MLNLFGSSIIAYLLPQSLPLVASSVTHKFAVFCIFGTEAGRYCNQYSDPLSGRLDLRCTILAAACSSSVVASNSH